MSGSEEKASIDNAGSDARAIEEVHDYVDDFSLYAAPVVELVVRALADYEPRDDTELPLREGELIQVVRQDSSGWWEGKREDDDTVGWFPSSYGEAYHEMWTIEEADDEEGEAF